LSTAGRKHDNHAGTCALLCTVVGPLPDAARYTPAKAGVRGCQSVRVSASTVTLGFCDSLRTWSSELPLRDTLTDRGALLSMPVHSISSHEVRAVDEAGGAGLQALNHAVEQRLARKLEPDPTLLPLNSASQAGSPFFLLRNHANCERQPPQLLHSGSRVLDIPIPGRYCCVQARVPSFMRSST